MKGQRRGTKRCRQRFRNCDEGLSKTTDRHDDTLSGRRTETKDGT